MHTGQTVSLKQILWQVLSHPLANDLTYDIAAEFAIEGLRLIGAPLIFGDKTTSSNDPNSPHLMVSSHKTLLPSDSLEIKGIRLIQNDELPERSAIALRYASDVYHNSALKNTLEEFTYTLQNGVIYTSFPEGCIEVSYKALITDKDGFPLVPDNQKVKLALEYYILHRYLAPLYDIGKITDKAFGRIEQNYLWYVGAAQNSMVLQGPDHLETIMNGINRIIVNTNLHSQFYKGQGDKEKLKRHR